MVAGSLVQGARGRALPDASVWEGARENLGFLAPLNSRRRRATKGRGDADMRRGISTRKSNITFRIFKIFPEFLPPLPNMADTTIPGGTYSC